MNDEKLILEGARFAVVKQIEKGGSMYAYRDKSKGSKWQTMDWVRIYGYLTEKLIELENKDAD